MNTNVPIICVGVLFLAYMFMNNGGIEGFPPAANSCGILQSAESEMLTMTPGDQGAITNGLIELAAQQRADKNILIAGMAEADCTSASAAANSDGHACNRTNADGTLNANCGYFYKSSTSNEVWGDGTEGATNTDITWRGGLL